jgi:hypothetical protein
MSCIFRFIGDDIDVSLLEQYCPSTGFLSFRKGEPRHDFRRSSSELPRQSVPRWNSPSIPRPI